jgi:hypothetical protein
MSLSGHITVFYLFDVAEAASLNELPPLLGESGVPGKLALKPATPDYVQYEQPPLAFDGNVIGLPTIDDFDVRVRVYDYGIVSLALSRPFAGTWTDLVALGPTLVENAKLEQQAEAGCRRLVERVAPALTHVRATLLTEDYVVFAVTDPGQSMSAEAMMAAHGNEMAQLLRGERQPLSRQERDEVLRHQISYFADDVVVPTWNASFVYDTQAGAQAALEILEFANSQLLQYRYYDELLDDELARLYAELQRHERFRLLSARRYTRAARQVHALVIDVRELLDRTENALKFVGDIYAARLFSLAAARLGLDAWKGHVRDKLRTLDDYYHFAVEQTGISRGELLESTIIAILVLELVLFFLGIMK